MSGWQEKVGSVFKYLKDGQSAYVDGVKKSITLSGDNLEKLAGFQLGMASSGVDAAVAQVKLLGQPGDLTSYVKGQVSLVSEGMETLSARASELKDVTTECVSDYVSLFKAPAKGKARTRKSS